LLHPQKAVLPFVCNTSAAHVRLRLRSHGIRPPHILWGEVTTSTHGRVALVSVWKSQFSNATKAKGRTHQQES